MQLDQEWSNHPVVKILLDIGFGMEEIAVFMEDGEVVREICYLYDIR